MKFFFSFMIIKSNKMNKFLLSLAIASTLGLVSQSVSAAQINIDPSLPFKDCSKVPDHATLLQALVDARKAANGGFGLDMWGTIVNRDGFVCAIAFTGDNRNGQWPGSRVISAQKANTANAFSLPGLSLSTANLYTATQPGGSLYGLQHSNPVDTVAAYADPIGYYGQANDPLVGVRVGGVNVFGGGLALYDQFDGLVGAIGVSGDSSCADHNIAWRTRNNLGLDFVPAGVNSDKTHPDNIVYDIHTVPGLQIGVSASGWGHPACNKSVAGIANALPPVSSKGK
jgi:uncharacterized protein GlcG (DUF336 family)